MSAPIPVLFEALRCANLLLSESADEKRVLQERITLLEGSIVSAHHAVRLGVASPMSALNLLGKEVTGLSEDKASSEAMTRLIETASPLPPSL